jgi:3-isopropylmalate/(R)-2-methylmalate dehydratase large subunit
MRINVAGLQFELHQKTLLYISKLSTSGATGYFVEYAGKFFENMTMEGRMTVCNLSIEMGARGGMIAPDQTTFDYLEGVYTLKGAAWDTAVAYWKTLKQMMPNLMKKSTLKLQTLNNDYLWN